MKSSGPGEFREIDRWDGGVGWLAHPEEGMQRASHALATDDGVYVVDPVDAEGLDDLLAEFGEVAGVVLLLDRHKRDCAAIARRHGVPVYVPSFMRGVAGELSAETSLFDGGVGGYELRTVVDNPLWNEGALFDEATGTLVVSESLGTVDYMTAPGERLGVHPMRRLTPPRSLRSLPVERVLVGHGAGVHERASEALVDAIDGAVRGAPSLYLKTLRSALSG